MQDKTSQKGRYRKPQLKHIGSSSQVERELTEILTFLTAYLQALISIANELSLRAAEARADGDLAQDVDKKRSYYAFADKCQRMSEDLHVLVSKFRNNNVA